VTETSGNDEIEALAELFEQSFPGHRCLRCGHLDFFILPSERQAFLMGEGAPQPKTLPVITLACARCGFIEQHLTDPLRVAVKPIKVESEDAPK
jgi:hypothetical protein